MPRCKIRRVRKDEQMTLAINALLSRSDLITEMFDARRDIDEECGYPKSITTQQYQYLWDREGIAKRVVEVWPKECWSENPEVLESEDPSETTFEKELKALQKRLNFSLSR